MAHLASYIESTIAAAVTGRTPASDLSKFDPAGGANPPAVNANFYLDAAGWDTSCIGWALWVSPTLVTLDAVITAGHWALANGDPVWFRGNNGTIYARKALSPSTTTGDVDLSVALLADVSSGLVSPLPADQFTPALLPQDDLWDYFIRHGYQTSCIRFNGRSFIAGDEATLTHRKEASIARLGVFFAGNIFFDATAHPAYPTWYAALVAGDSGAPIGIPDGSKRFLLLGQAGITTDVLNLKAEIAARLSTLGSGYTIAESNLSADFLKATMGQKTIRATAPVSNTGTTSADGGSYPTALNAADSSFVNFTNVANVIVGTPSPLVPETAEITAIQLLASNASVTTTAGATRTMFADFLQSDRASVFTIESTLAERLSGAGAGTTTVASFVQDPAECDVTGFGFTGADINAGGFKVRTSGGGTAKLDELSALITYTLDVPTAPVLAAAANGQTQIDLSWTVTPASITDFTIDRKIGAGAWTTGYHTIADGTAMTWSDTGLAAETSYSYRIRATNETGDSPDSNTASATPTTPAAPAAPGSLMLIFTRTIRVPDASGTLTDADSTPTISIVRTDTSVEVVAATAMTHDSTGRYSYTLSSPVSGVTYRATYTIVVSGQAITSSSEKTAGSTSASSYYGNQQDVEDLIGAEALRLISNEPGATSDTATDSVRLQRFGDWADAYIDTKMAQLGYVTPMTGMSGATIIIMADIWAHLVAYSANESRMLTTLSAGRAASSIDTVMQAHRDVAEMILKKIAYKQILITADRLYATAPAGKVYVPTYAGTIAAPRVFIGY